MGAQKENMCYNDQEDEDLQPQSMFGSCCKKNRESYDFGYDPEMQNNSMLLNSEEIDLTKGRNFVLNQPLYRFCLLLSSLAFVGSLIAIFQVNYIKFGPPPSDFVGATFRDFQTFNINNLTKQIPRYNNGINIIIARHAAWLGEAHSHKLSDAGYRQIKSLREDYAKDMLPHPSKIYFLTHPQFTILASAINAVTQSQLVKLPHIPPSLESFTSPKRLLLAALQGDILRHVSNVLVIWRHDEIPYLLQQLGCNDENLCPQEIEENDFDHAWKITLEFTNWKIPLPKESPLRKANFLLCPPYVAQTMGDSFCNVLI